MLKHIKNIIKETAEAAALPIEENPFFSVSSNTLLHMPSEPTDDVLDTIDHTPNYGVDENIRNRFFSKILLLSPNKLFVHYLDFLERADTTQIELVKKCFAFNKSLNQAFCRHYDEYYRTKDTYTSVRLDSNSQKPTNIAKNELVIQKKIEGYGVYWQDNNDQIREKYISNANMANHIEELPEKGKSKNKNLIGNIALRLGEISLSYIENTIFKLSVKLTEADATEIIQTSCRNHLNLLNINEFKEILGVLLAEQVLSETPNKYLESFLNVWIQMALEEKLDPINELKGTNVNLDYKRAIQFNKTLLEQERKNLESDLKNLQSHKVKYTRHYVVTSVPENQAINNIKQKINDKAKNPNQLMSQEQFAKFKPQPEDELKNLAHEPDNSLPSDNQETIPEKFVVGIYTKIGEQPYEFYQIQDYNMETKLYSNSKNSLHIIEQKIEVLTKKIEEIDKKIKRLEDLLNGFFNFLTYNKELVSKKLEVLQNYKEEVEFIRDSCPTSGDKLNVQNELEKFNDTFKSFETILMEHRHPEPIRWLIKLFSSKSTPDTAQVLTSPLVMRN